MTTPALLTVEYLPIGDLKPDLFIPRRISDEELEALTRSIQQFGLVDPIIVRRADLTVIGGHQRLVAARRLGYDAVPVVLVDLSQEQARLLNVALNKIAGTWDQELLARLLKDLSIVPELDLSLSGFSEDELQKLLKSLEARDKRDKIEDFNLEDALAAAEATSATQPGDLWLLGDHRLLCGDVTNAEDVARLFNGETAALMDVAVGDREVVKCWSRARFGVSVRLNGP